MGKKEVYGDTNINISHITDDSRDAKKDSLFIAIKGLTHDANDHIEEALKRGARAVVGERNIKLKDATYIKVDDSRAALSVIASAWNDNPAKKLKIIGVTGTDGKTTTSTIIYWLLKEAGFKVGLITSVSAEIRDKEVDTGFHVTNPEPIPLQAFLRKMVEEDSEYAVIEVTSHGLDQKRVYGVPFEVGVLTNITHEHLDYHGSFADYTKAKAKLFQLVGIAILNKSDSSFELIRKYIPKTVKIISYPGADLDKTVKKAIKERFSQDYNQLNAEAASLVAKEYGVASASMARAISTFPAVSGRLQEVANKKGIKIYVDFAHTPNALKSVLSGVKKGTRRRIIAVFGCAGERDTKKRPMMGKISSELADFTVITSEDPRSEDPNNIIDQMISRIKGDKNYIAIPERGEAIYHAINKVAKKGDTVIICGKGHEKSMAYGKREYPWSDFEAVEMALKGKVKTIKR